MRKQIKKTRPPLSLPGPEITDPFILRFGSTTITASPLKLLPRDTADPGIVRLGSTTIASQR